MHILSDVGFVTKKANQFPTLSYHSTIGLIHNQSASSPQTTVVPLF